jgi:hypothetical protein
MLVRDVLSAKGNEVVTIRPSATVTEIVGALAAHRIGAGTTALAQFGFGYGDAGARIAVENWPLYWGGLAVVVLALLPATGRWAGRIRRARIGQPGVTGTTETGAILWPGT